MTFFQTYKKSIIGALITVAIGGGIPTGLWIHNAYADQRYVSKSEAADMQIQQLDNKIFECQQEADLAKTPEEKAKWQTRKLYYENQKAALIRKLEKPAT